MRPSRLAESSSREAWCLPADVSAPGDGQCQKRAHRHCEPLEQLHVPTSPPGFRSITLEADPHLGDLAGSLGGTEGGDKPPMVPTVKRVLSGDKGRLGYSNYPGEESICPQ